MKRLDLFVDLIVVAGLFITLPAVISLASTPSPQPPRTPQPSPGPLFGKVIEIKGKAWASPDLEGKTKTEIQSGYHLHPNEFLFTGPESQVLVLLGAKDAALLVKQNSKFQIYQTAQGEWWVDLTQGALLVQFKQQEKRGKQLQIKTRSATLGIRGPSVFVKQGSGQDAGKGLFVCTCEGILSLDSKVLILGKHHNAPKWILEGTQALGKRLKNAEKGSEHSDAEIQILEKLLKA